MSIENTIYDNFPFDQETAQAAIMYIIDHSHFRTISAIQNLLFLAEQEMLVLSGTSFIGGEFFLYPDQTVQNSHILTCLQYDTFPYIRRAFDYVCRYLESEQIIDWQSQKVDSFSNSEILDHLSVTNLKILERLLHTYEHYNDSQLQQEVNNQLYIQNLLNNSLGDRPILLKWREYLKDEHPGGHYSGADYSIVVRWVEDNLINHSPSRFV